jgi:hypothetical protein
MRGTTMTKEESAAAHFIRSISRSTTRGLCHGFGRSSLRHLSARHRLWLTCLRRTASLIAIRMLCSRSCSCLCAGHFCCAGRGNINSLQMYKFPRYQKRDGGHSHFSCDRQLLQRCVWSYFLSLSRNSAVEARAVLIVAC